jgi:tetratricopeptide (TPR) repeat protein
MPPGINPFRRFLTALRWDKGPALLRTTILSGIILALLTGSALIFVSRYRPKAAVPPAGSFYPSLQEYDAALLQSRESPELLNQRLDRLENEAQGVESSLSVLKRRRALARTDPRFGPACRDAARRAAAAYPYSEPLAALAAAAVLQGSAITADAAAELRGRASLLTAAGLLPLRVSLYILLGDFKSPQSAGALPRIDDTLTAALPLLRGKIPSPAGEALSADLAILKVLAGDTGGAAAEIQGALYQNSAAPQRPSPAFLRFAAEFFYDFRDPLRAAELFSRLDTEEDLIRQADALWLAGRTEGARNIWAILAAPAGTPPPAAASVPARSLYNLALSAGDSRETAALFERLTALPFPDPASAGSEAVPGPAVQSRIYGIIRYSRLKNTAPALALLEGGDKMFPGSPLLELELLRRRGETWEPGRMIGETWLLLGRRPQSEELYRWAAWYFERQRQPAETAMLLKTAVRRGFDAPWIRFHEALSLMETGNLDQAAETLQAIPPETADWEVFADLGRIFESRRSPAAALEYYETAASKVQPPQEAARIQIRIARCLQALGRARESRRVLEYAKDLDPGNLRVRLELDRLDIPAY